MQHPSNIPPNIPHPSCPGIVPDSVAEIGQARGREIRKLAGTERQLDKRITQAQKSRRHCVINLGRHLTQSCEGSGKRDQKPKLEDWVLKSQKPRQRVYPHKVKRPHENLSNTSQKSR